MFLMVWGLFTRRYRLCSTMEIPDKVGISETLFFCLRFLILKSVEISRRFGKQIYRLHDGISRSLQEYTGIISDRELEVTLV